MSDVTEAPKTNEVESVPARVVMNQLADASIEAQSPLHHADLSSVAQSGPKTGGVVFKEEKLMGQLTLRLNADNADQLAIAEKLLGVALPLTPLTSVVEGDVSIRWISPDEWLIVVPGLKAFDVESAFHEQMTGHYQLVNISGGSTIFLLSGEHARDVLKKSTPIDVHPNEFPVGKVVSTVFAKSSAVMRRVADDQYELVVRRSFADYLWLWLQDASREYGLVVEV